jgi:hypothetical protein
MSIGHKYVTQLLQKVEAGALLQFGNDAAKVISKVETMLNRSGDIREKLEGLYVVSGFEQFAIRLLWLIDFVRVDGAIPNESVMNFESEHLLSLLKPALKCDAFSQEIESPVSVETDFERALNRFGNVVEKAKREIRQNGSMNPIAKETLELLCQAPEQLKATGIKVSRGDTVEMMEEFLSLIRWVIEERCDDNVRLLGIIHTTNLVLQTTHHLDECENNDALQQTLEILRNPENIFGPTHLRASEVHG